MKRIVLALIVLSFLGCKQNASSQKKQDAPTVETQNAEKQNNSIVVAGDYAYDTYHKREQGYDWVAVRITELTDNQIGIKIRSREDIKTPSCTFDGVADKVSQGVYQMKIDDAVATFTFTDDGELSITESKMYTLTYYCSGGGTLVGSYYKVSEPISELNAN